MAKKYIVYAGTCFTIEFYRNRNGNSQPLDYFYELSDDEKEEAFMLFKRMGDNGKINDTTKFRHEGKQIYAFKPRPNRFFCFFASGKRIIITNAFEKKKDELKQSFMKIAIRNRKDYLETLGE